MDAGTIRCPSCGAPAEVGHLALTPSAGPPTCAYCTAVLSTVACPSCLGRVFVGMKFCPHCGTRNERRQEIDESPISCPSCSESLGAARVGSTLLRDCPSCGGVWVDKESFQGVSADRERQAAILLATPKTPEATISAAAPVRYVRCPVCRVTMNRKQFSRGAKLVVDVCGKHGVWFDRDELRQAVEFIREGGMDRARDRDRSDLEHERRRLEAAQSNAMRGGGPAFLMQPATGDASGAKAVVSLIQLASRFVGNLFD